MNNEISVFATRAIVGYLFALLITRIMGRKVVSQMTFFDFIIGVTLGSLVGNLILSTKNTFTSGIIVLSVLTVLIVIIDYAHTKSYFIRKIVNSEPVVIIDKGEIANKNMAKLRLTVDELVSKLREKNVFNIADVEFAIMETDGQVSVLPKSDKAPLTPSDVNIKTDYKGLTSDIIIDGVIIKENLRNSKKDDKWILEQLKNNNIQNVQDIFYAGLDSSGSLYVSLKKQKTQKR